MILIVGGSVHELARSVAASPAIPLIAPWQTAAQPAGTEPGDGPRVPTQANFFSSLGLPSTMTQLPPHLLVHTEIAGPTSSPRRTVRVTAPDSYPMPLEELLSRVELHTRTTIIASATGAPFALDLPAGVAADGELLCAIVFQPGFGRASEVCVCVCVCVCVWCVCVVCVSIYPYVSMHVCVCDSIPFQRVVPFICLCPHSLCLPRSHFAKAPLQAALPCEVSAVTVHVPPLRLPAAFADKVREWKVFVSRSRTCQHAHACS